MQDLDDQYGILTARHQYVTLTHEKDKVIVFEKGVLLFVFNFHPSKSYEHYRVATNWPSDHFIILDTDEKRFDGKERLKYGHEHKYSFSNEKWMNRNGSIKLYIPSRTAIVLIADENYKNN
jgi:1,4-alpha-glucan branching enzyme